jgi:hypothetical protein
MPGFIKLYRDLQENPIWQEKPFSKGQAWVDMIFRCNHRCVRMGPQYQNVLVRRGSFLLSNVKLAEAWGWNEKTVRRFIKYLADCKMVKYFSYSKFSIYELQKYAEYQALENEQLQETRAEHKPSISRAEAEQKPTNKNDNNNKNDKKIKNNIVNLQEIIKVITDYTSNQDLKMAINDFIDYRKQIKKPLTVKALNLNLKELNKLTSDDKTKIAILNQSIMNSWQGLFPLKQNKSTGTTGNIGNVFLEIYKEEMNK